MKLSLILLLALAGCTKKSGDVATPSTNLIPIAGPGVQKMAAIQPEIPKYPALIIDKESTEKTITTGEPAWIHWQCPQGFHTEPTSAAFPHHPHTVILDENLPNCVKDVTEAEKLWPHFKEIRCISFDGRGEGIVEPNYANPDCWPKERKP